MTDIEGFRTIYGHSDNLLNNNSIYLKLQTATVCVGPVCLRQNHDILTDNIANHSHT